MQTPSKTLGNLSTRGDFRQLSERATQESSKRKESEAGEIPSDHPIWDVWDAVKGFYPGVTVNWDSEPPMIWLATLGDLTAEQLGAGVMNLCHHTDDNGANGFPPNAGQFRNLCMNDFGWESKRLHKPYDPHADICDWGADRLLEAPKDERTVDEIRAELRSTMGIK